MQKKQYNMKIPQITFVIPSRNNLEFLKLAYESIRRLDKKYTEVFDGAAATDREIKHKILVLNDASEDGTQEWLYTLDHDDDLIVIENPGPNRIGIVGMFDKGVEMAETDIICGFHADMVVSEEFDYNILKHLKKGTVVSATRVEPPLHPEGPEKIIHDFGVESEQFSMEKWVTKSKSLCQSNKTTEGIFAPWCMYKEDYLAIGGHDELFAPQSREDSDLFNRFVLKGYDLIQSWDALVYHFTSRGSRFNKHAGGDTGKNSQEWIETNHRNMRNFIRKWGQMVQHDEFMKPIVPPKYDIGFVVKNCDYGTLYELEPWCSTIYVDWGNKSYIEVEQTHTRINLKDRVKSIIEDEPDNDIIVEFDAKDVTPERMHFIAKLPYILKDSGEVGEMEHDIFKLKINKLDTYEKDLIDAV